MMANNVDNETPRDPPHPGNASVRSFTQGIVIGLVIACLLGAGLYAGVILPLTSDRDHLNKEVADLNAQVTMLNGQLQTLQSMYGSLQDQLGTKNQSYQILDLKYNLLDAKYLAEVASYNKLLLDYNASLSNYNALKSVYDDVNGKYLNIAGTGDMKYIRLLYFQSGYFSTNHWLYLEIEPELFLHYREQTHWQGNLLWMSMFPSLVVTDGVTERIVSAVKNCTSANQEDLADALLSIAQNKGNAAWSTPPVNEGVVGSAAKENFGTYYNIDGLAKYPIETLVFGGGECLDDAILYSALLKQAGIPAGLCLTTSGTHAFTGVGLGTAPSHIPAGRTTGFFNSSATLYYPAEVTNFGCFVGEMTTSMSTCYILSV
jgi:hypothetical protein